MPDLAHLRSWIGREEIAHDVAGAGPLAGLAALLDREQPFAQSLPPLAHWLYFLPYVRQSLIGADGHPLRGGFLPPVALPRRMWAGGRIRFVTPIGLGARMQRRSVIDEIKRKSGASGDLVFVTLRHEISADGELALVEEQDLVYRGEQGEARPEAATEARRTADRERIVSIDPVQLFRFSALTFNSHCIHYDRDYARVVEGYRGLVVHAPLLATLLVHFWLAQDSSAPIRNFSFRALQPLLDDAPFALCLKRRIAGGELWTRDHAGRETMRAELDCAPG